jgi:ATPase subunit of ABC transporter with duplicated ATPase domains
MTMKTGTERKPAKVLAVLIAAFFLTVFLTNVCHCWGPSKSSGGAAGGHPGGVGPSSEWDKFRENPGQWAKDKWEEHEREEQAKRDAEKARKAEEARLAELVRKAEEAKKAADAAKAEEARLTKLRESAGDRNNNKNIAQRFSDFFEGNKHLLEGK